jgi:RNA polymerase sigma-70 factor (ECF subfamily)
MYFIEEKNVDEISKLLERPKKTVQTQIIRAKGLLQKLLKEEYKHERAF